ncbi:MAG TPA: hypothetical protein VGH95_04020 [Candidatus Aquirickettsiella sp.]|jgi:hypothetical protein
MPRIYQKSVDQQLVNKAIAEGIITREQYLRLSPLDVYFIDSLFSPAGQKAITEGVITFEQYLLIPPDERQNVITALQDPETRQRIINKHIAVENIIGVTLSPVGNYFIESLFRRKKTVVDTSRFINVKQYHLETQANEHQNVITASQDPNTRQKIIISNTLVEYTIGIRHTAIVDQYVSESAIRLLKLYESRINDSGLENILKEAQDYITGLDDTPKNNAAKRGFLRILAPEFTFIDSNSLITAKQLLALTFLAIHDAGKRNSSLEAAKMQFVEALYEIQRGYNLSQSGIDEGFRDRYLCPAGIFNKLIEKLHGIHPDCQVLYLTKENVSVKLPTVVREEGMKYLENFANPNTDEALLKFTLLMEKIKKNGVQVIWDHIKNNITNRMFSEFGSFFRDITEPNFTALIEDGQDVELGQLTLLIYPQINLQLNKLENKAINLRDRGHTLASSKAIHIVELLRGLNQDFFIEKKINYDNYRSRAFDVINQNRSVLDQHRGYKQILGNLLILIATLGTGLLVNKACTGNFMFFKTNSSQHINVLNNMLEKMESHYPRLNN